MADSPSSKLLDDLQTQLSARFAQKGGPFRSLIDVPLRSWEHLATELLGKTQTSGVSRREFDVVEFHLRFEPSQREHSPGSAREIRATSTLEGESDEARCYGRPVRCLRLDVRCPSAWVEDPEACFDFLASLWNGGRVLLDLGDPFLCHRHLPDLVLRGIRSIVDGGVALRCNYVWCAAQTCGKWTNSNETNRNPPAVATQR